MNLLIDKLPCSVTVNSKSYSIVTAWKEWVKLYCIIDDIEISETEKIISIMQYFTNEKPPDVALAVRAILDFAACKDVPHAGTPKKSKQAAGKAACFSWLYDAPFVLSAFRQCYNIDLIDSSMHWYVFLALFQGLPDDIPLKKRMQLRSIKPSSIKDRQRRIEIIHAQEAIALPHPELQETEIDESIFDGFFMQTDKDGGE